jgi:hypothetical protein
MTSEPECHVKPGFNPHVVIDHFTPEERTILNRMSKDWYITNAGTEISLSPTNTYRGLGGQTYAFHILVWRDKAVGEAHRTGSR